jgi:hypothetical protein
MKIEKLIIEKEARVDPVCFKFQAQPYGDIDYERIASMVYYLLYPTDEIKTSINSFRFELQALKIKEPEKWQEKLCGILISLNCTDPRVQRLILSGQYPYNSTSSLYPPEDKFESISYYYKNLSHPSIESYLSEYFIKDNKPDTYKTLLGENQKILYEYTSLLHRKSPDTLIEVFETVINEYFIGKTIEDIVKFIQCHLDTLRIVPNGKLLHMVYALIGKGLSGNKGAKTLADYFHNSLIKGTKPEKFVELYMLCEQKDIFERIYCGLCLDRLLVQKDLSIEEGVVREIKEFSGPDSMDFPGKLIRDAKEYNIDDDKLNVIVITNKIHTVLGPYKQISQGYLPRVLPVELETMKNQYEAKFRENYPKKVIKWEFLRSIIELSYGKAIIKCNFLQSLILLMFNASASIPEQEILYYISRNSLKTEVLSEKAVKSELESLNSLLILKNKNYSLLFPQTLYLDITPGPESTLESEEIDEDATKDIRKPM